MLESRHSHVVSGHGFRQNFLLAAHHATHQTNSYSPKDPLPLRGPPPRKAASTPSAVRAFVGHVEREARQRLPKLSKKARRSRAPANYLRPDIVGQRRRPEQPGT